MAARYKRYSISCKLSDWTMNSISGLMVARGPPFLSIALGSEAVKGAEIIDAWSWLGALPFHLEVKLFNCWRISMLEADWGLSPFIWSWSYQRVREYRCLKLTGSPSLSFDTEAIKMSENINAWSWLGALNFLMIVLSRETIQEVENIDACSWSGTLPFLSIVFGSKPIKVLENIDAWSWLSPRSKQFGEYRHSKPTDNSESIDAWSWPSPWSRCILFGLN